MGVAVAHSLSPELALVCPELRAHALALLPAVDPDALFALAPRPRTEVPRAAEVPLAKVPLPVAFAAYAAEAVLLMALRGAVLTTSIAVAAFLAAW